MTTVAPAVAAAPKKSAKAAVAPAAATVPVSAFRVSFDAPMPEVKRGRVGATAKYPFDQLPEPQGDKFASFPLFDKDAKKIQSTVYSAIKRHGKLDDAGKLIERVRDFKAVNVDPTTDPDGAICRVFRIK